MLETTVYNLHFILMLLIQLVYLTIRLKQSFRLLKSKVTIIVQYTFHLQGNNYKFIFKNKLGNCSNSISLPHPLPNPSTSNRLSCKV